MCRVTCCAVVVAMSLTAHAVEAGRAAWMAGAQYGVFVHFLGEGPEWNARVNGLDAAAFAKQMKAAGAGYVIFTLGQNSGYYCSPNTTYDRYTGHQAGERCSIRDLPMDLANALAEYKIPLMLYLPSRSPQQDLDAMMKLGDVRENEPAPQEFTERWSEIISEWSLRYGEKVAGWWFDGSYNTLGWDDLSLSRNWNTWAEACRAGNPKSALAFNPGVNDKAFQRLTAQQDYSAGEQNEFGATPEMNPAPAGLQWHILCYLGTWWSKPDGPRRPDAWMIDYIRTVNNQGGAVTMDVSVDGNGAVYGPQQQQLEAIAAALRKP